MFLWQVNHERLLTNLLRANRNISNCALCPFECDCEETLLHILRDCLVASEVWSKFINPNFLSRFFSLSLQEWLHWNLKREIGMSQVNRWPWRKVFSLGYWNIWKNRCRGIFNNDRLLVQRVFQSILHHLREDKALKGFRKVILQSRL